MTTSPHLNTTALLLFTQLLLLISCLWLTKTKPSKVHLSVRTPNCHLTTHTGLPSKEIANFAVINCQFCSYKWMFSLLMAFWSWSPYMEIKVFWGVMLWHWLSIFWHFKAPYCLHLQDQAAHKEQPCGKTRCGLCSCATPVTHVYKIQAVSRTAILLRLIGAEGEGTLLWQSVLYL
jgi:hypothetical protein